MSFYNDFRCSFQIFVSRIFLCLYLCAFSLRIISFRVFPMRRLPMLSPFISGSVILLVFDFQCFPRVCVPVLSTVSWIEYLSSSVLILFYVFTFFRETSSILVFTVGHFP